MSDAIQTAIQNQARELLQAGSVECVIGYERSKRGQVRPTFVYDVEEVERLIWGDACRHNLMVFLHERKHPPGRDQEPPTTAVVAKPCDVRGLNVLLQEGQIQRDKVFVIGVACQGMQASGGTLEGRCQRCTERVPVLYDVLVGEAEGAPTTVEDWADVVKLEEMTSEERLAFWTAEFDRCIRCYACRQACPGCYCFECMAEMVDPLWTSIAHEVPEKAFFHIMRAYHLTGRCVECDACEHACPMDIPLGLLNRKLAKEVQELFDYQAGGDSETRPPMATFRPDEDLPL